MFSVFLLNIIYFSVCLTSNKLCWIEDQLTNVSTRFFTSVSWRRRVGVGELVRRRVDHNSVKYKAADAPITVEEIVMVIIISLMGLEIHSYHPSVAAFPVHHKVHP